MQEAKEKLLNSYNDLLSDKESSLTNAMVSASGLAERSFQPSAVASTTAWEKPAPWRRSKTSWDEHWLHPLHSAWRPHRRA